MLVDQLVFRHFWNVLAVAGALAEWTLWCWLAGSPRAELHLLVPPALALTNRLAARVFEREPGSGPLLDGLGRVLSALAFAAIAGAGALGATACVWATLQLLGALRAEAGTVGPDLVAELFGPGFAPLAGSAMALVMGAVAYGYAWGHRRLVVTHVTVPVAQLPPTLAGLRLVHVSDLHVGPIADRGALREALDRVVALDPDVVCVTGDIVDSRATDLDAWIPELARLSARHGVFAILGNHDLFAGADRIAAAIARFTTWRVLRDEVATLDVDGARLHLLGLDHRAVPHAVAQLPALVGAVPPGEPAILLAHHPDVFPAAATAGVSLTLAGHTHGGQLAVPGLPRLNPARLQLSRFDAGCFTQGRAHLHVNRGLGTSAQRVRIGVPREITVVTLAASEAAAA